MKKIMFNDKYGLTQAVLEGRKTMTRRVITNEVAIAHCEKGYTDLALNYAQYQVGEVVAIAQRLVDVFYECKLERDVYHNDNGWNNKMFVKAKDMPHHIRITNIRVERLQDISNEDCLREGVGRCKESIVIGYPFGVPFNFYIKEETNDNRYSTPREAFSVLIKKVSGEGTWERNPWVFIYEFELID